MEFEERSSSKKNYLARHDAGLPPASKDGRRPYPSPNRTIAQLQPTGCYSLTSNVRPLFLLAAFLSSGLLFVVEPLAAKLILPTFGGTAQVWNASMLFFQTVLLLGYLYAHLSATKLSPAISRWLHLGVLLLAVVTLPISIRNTVFQHVRDLAANGGPPLPLVLTGLAGLIGLPFFALSANSSTLQRWYSLSGEPDASQPWFLYAAGNVGSMLALLAYPTVIEPRLTLSAQGVWWAVGFGVLIVLLAACAIASRRTAATEPAPEPLIPETEAGVPAVDESVDSIPPPKPPDRNQKILWLALSAVPSSLLLGVTTFVSSNIAPIPMLWVIPLALYLLTFILVFAKNPKTPLNWLGRVYPIVLTPLALIIVLQSTEPYLAPIHLAVFFIAAWMCHSRLALSKPAAEHLTEYFFYISLGGVLGGAFNTIVAPIAFNTFAEYPIALVGVALLVPFRKGNGPNFGLDAGYAGMIAIAMILLAFITQLLHIPASPVLTFVTIGLPAILCFLAVDSPTRFGFAMASAFFVAEAMHFGSDGTVPLTERSFFGVHRIVLTNKGRHHKLLNGNTVHGIQDLDHPDTPLTYYYPKSPIGLLIAAVPPKTAAFVGLGVGSLAAYGQPGDHFTYYEIDPVVRQLATDPHWFTFLSRSKAQVDIRLGDARLELSRATETYDLIVLDAFSSDAIPIHLLTEEAIRMYLRHLNPDGILAFHISNRYLDLSPILAAAKADLGLTGYEMTDAPDTDYKEMGAQQSDWVVMARSKQDFGPLKLSWWDDLQPTPNVKPWTDDYSNVLSRFSLNK